jgi:hypothetical protein
MDRERLSSVGARMLPSRRRFEGSGDLGQQFIIFRYLARCPGSERRSNLLPKLTPVQEKEKTFSHSVLLLDVTLREIGKASANSLGFYDRWVRRLKSLWAGGRTWVPAQ